MDASDFRNGHQIVSHQNRRSGLVWVVCMYIRFAYFVTVVVVVVVAVFFLLFHLPFLFRLLSFMMYFPIVSYMFLLFSQFLGALPISVDVCGYDCVVEQLRKAILFIWSIKLRSTSSCKCKDVEHFMMTSEYFNRICIDFFISLYFTLESLHFF